MAKKNGASAEKNNQGATPLASATLSFMNAAASAPGKSIRTKHPTTEKRRKKSPMTGGGSKNIGTAFFIF